MNTEFSRHIALPGTFNIRDLGGYLTETGTKTLWRRALRAGSLHRLSEESVSRLIEGGVTAVVDLRRPEETEEAPNPFRNRAGARYVNISLFSELAPGADAARVPGADILFDLYMRALLERPAVVCECLEAIAALPEFEERARAKGQDLVRLRALLVARRATMQAMLDQLGQRFGGVSGYLADAGLPPEVVGPVAAGSIAWPRGWKRRLGRVPARSCEDACAWSEWSSGHDRNH